MRRLGGMGVRHGGAARSHVFGGRIIRRALGDIRGPLAGTRRRLQRLVRARLITGGRWAMRMFRENVQRCPAAQWVEPQFRRSPSFQAADCRVSWPRRPRTRLHRSPNPWTGTESARRLINTSALAATSPFCSTNHSLLLLVLAQLTLLRIPFSVALSRHSFRSAYNIPSHPGFYR